MKLETVGWWVFLISIVVFAVTLIYTFGRLIIEFIVDTLVAYHNNTLAILIWSLVASFLGVLLIKASSSQNDSEL